MLELVATLQQHDSVEIRLAARTAAAIARIDARRNATLAPDLTHPAWAAVERSVTVTRTTASRWRDDAWQAVGEGLIAPADAQALSDQLEPRGAA